MTIFPAIDLRGGRCVRLLQGRADAETVYSDDPAAMAARFQHEGAQWVHVVDLDGSFRGAPANQAAVRAVVATGLKVQLGGGLRDEEAVTRALDAGIARAVIGTRAAEDSAFVQRLVEEHGPKVAVGIDARAGRVAVKGWVETTALSALELARRMEGCGVQTLIYTDIATDGMLTGPNLPALTALLSSVKCAVIASGGVAGLGDVEALAALVQRFPNLAGVITGKAIYERTLSLPDAIRAAQSA